jgi:hypothetical protein
VKCGTRAPVVVSMMRLHDDGVSDTSIVCAPGQPSKVAPGKNLRHHSDVPQNTRGGGHPHSHARLDAAKWRESIEVVDSSALGVEAQRERVRGHRLELHADARRAVRVRAQEEVVRERIHALHGTTMQWS